LGENIEISTLVVSALYHVYLASVIFVSVKIPNCVNARDMGLDTKTEQY